MVWFGGLVPGLPPGPPHQDQYLGMHSPWIRSEDRIPRAGQGLAASLTPSTPPACWITLYLPPIGVQCIMTRAIPAAAPGRAVTTELLRAWHRYTAVITARDNENYGGLLRLLNTFPNSAIYFQNMVSFIGFKAQLSFGSV